MAERVNVKVTTYQVPCLDNPCGSEFHVLLVFRDHPGLMGEAALNRVVDIVAERYVEEHFVELAKTIEPAQLLALVQAKATEKLAALLLVIPTSQRKGKYAGVTEKPLMTSWADFLAGGGTL